LLTHRHIHAPEILDVGASDEEKEKHRITRMVESEEEEEEDELSDEEIERRRQMLREKVLNHRDDEVWFAVMTNSVAFVITVIPTSALLFRRWRYWTKRTKVTRLRRVHLSHQNMRSTAVSETRLIKVTGIKRDLSNRKTLAQFLVLSDSEEEAGPRLKPVFVRKKDRVTVMEKEREALRQKQAEIEAKKMAEERRKYTLKVPRHQTRTQ
jgi:microfibrillar-associated protein 1